MCCVVLCCVVLCRVMKKDTWPSRTSQATGPIAYLGDEWRRLDRTLPPVLVIEYSDLLEPPLIGKAQQVGLYRWAGPCRFGAVDAAIVYLS